MRLCVISDTHSLHDELAVPESDVLIHCGDYSNHGTLGDLLAFNKWLGTLPQKHKLVISGNHDIWASQVTKVIVQEFLTNAIYLENESAYVDGKTFWGSPFTPLYGHWAFMRTRGDAMAAIWAGIPRELDVLITHGAPQGILDTNVNHELCGCYDLRQAIQKRQIQHSVFGHIHEGYGSITLDDTTYSNCSVLNEHYELVNNPIVIDI